MKKFLVLIPVIALLALPLLAGAQVLTEQTFVQGATITDLIQIVNNIARWFMTIVVAISIIFFVMAGFLYVTSGGKEDSVKSAKNYLLYGVIGVGVALLAGAIQAIVVALVSQS